MLLKNLNVNVKKFESQFEIVVLNAICKMGDDLQCKCEQLMGGLENG